MLKAVIFDFDGIIVDTEPIHFQAFQSILQPLGLGYSWDEYLEKYIGFDDRDAFREAFSSTGNILDDVMLGDLINRKAEFFERIVRQGVQPYPGVLDLVKALSGNLPLGLCSGALRRDIMPILEQFGLQTAFDIIVTADDVQASKPDPESYLLSIKRLTEVFQPSNILPQDCIAIEDTPAGILSASGAGLHVIAVTNSYEKQRLGGAIHITDSLENITIGDLRSFLE
ncbi:MAG: HAD family phosphatase [Deltaproteobacteria bacterium]|nr:HAD family phosphatase [Deltaproteobacteria bacterium]TLN03787.1 MAG: HAD family phosphatase [bacterium]